VVFGPWGLSRGEEIAWPMVGSCAQSRTSVLLLDRSQVGTSDCTVYRAASFRRQAWIEQFFKTRLKDFDKSVQDFLNRGDTHVPDGGTSWKADIAGPEFGAARQGLRVLIVWALYGLKSSGMAWHSHLAQTMSDLKFQPCVADPDVWLRPAVKSNGDKYYEYVLIYVDDILAFSEKPDCSMETLSGLYKLKKIRRPGRSIVLLIVIWVLTLESINCQELPKSIGT
jgi:hypothetical protein